MFKTWRKRSFAENRWFAKTLRETGFLTSYGKTLVWADKKFVYLWLENGFDGPRFVRKDVDFKFVLNAIKSEEWY